MSSIPGHINDPTAVGHFGMDGDGDEVDASTREEALSSALRALTRNATSTASSLPFPLSQLALVGGTILPAPFAQLVTALALGTRVSIRVTAFFLEAMLESSRYSTQVSLGITRRMLISAVTAARTSYLLTERGFASIGAAPSGDEGDVTRNNFLRILDCYTNVGVYFLHHTFSMAELFTMSGFSLVSTALKSTHAVAEESVNAFDAIFGSNETSRSLASIISLVQKELLQDPRFEAAGKSKVASWTALTKALTAFACLQNATWARQLPNLGLKVLYDCTVISGQQEQRGSAQLEGALRDGENKPLPTIQNNDDWRASLQTPSPRRSSNTIGTGSEASTPQSCHMETVQAQDILGELDDFVGESGDELVEGTITSRQRRRSRRILQIQEEVIETQTLAQRATLHRVPLDEIYFPHDIHMDSDSEEISRETRPGRMSEDPTVTIVHRQKRPASSILSSGRQTRRGSAFVDMDEWIEVEELLRDHAIERGPIPEAANGQSVIHSSYRDALDRPQENAKRFETILRTMTTKLMQKRTTTRRIVLEQDDDEDDEPTIRLPARALDRPRAARSDVRRLEWRPVTPGSSPSRMSTDSSVAGSESPSASQVSMAARRAADLPSPPTFTPANSPRRSLKGSLSNSGLGRAVDRARLALTGTKRKQSGKQVIFEPSETSSQSSMDQSHTSLVIDELDSSDNPRTPRPRQPPREPPSAKQTVNAPHSSRIRGESHFHETRSMVHSVADQSVPKEEEVSGLWPPSHLISNLHRYMKFASAAYGQNFLKLLGMGTTDFNYPTTGTHHANSWSFAAHTNLPIDSILLSGYCPAPLVSDKAPALVHYVTVDHAKQSIVLTCRGSLGLSDILVDLTCDSIAIEVDGGDPEASYLVHEGMWQAALQLRDPKSVVHETVRQTLAQHKDYGLVLTGHSLGGGVASLLAIACSAPKNNLSGSLAQGSSSNTAFVTSAASGFPAGRPIHCYAYGPPCVASPDLADYARGLVTSCVNGSDVITCLSLGVLRDMKNIAITLYEEGSVAEEIVGRAVGLYQRKSKESVGRKHSGFSSLASTYNTPPIVDGQAVRKGRNRADEEGYVDPALEAVAEVPGTRSGSAHETDWLWSLIKTMRADMDSDKLLPAGKVYEMEMSTVFVTQDIARQTRKEGHRAILREVGNVRARFGEPIFTRTMLHDHLPSVYEATTRVLVEGLDVW